MPSPRRRIGFLPSEEVHNIIEELCREGNFSQSKITGILVEEALKSRGILKSTHLQNIDGENKNVKNKINNPIFSDLFNSQDIYKINKENLAEDLLMINEFINFKFFKKVMKENRDLLG
tara:strand:- start:14 stop:370 length:357 start_codon:yes stop_codon:yes gene_type:complete